MKKAVSIRGLMFLLVAAATMAYFSACNSNSTTSAYMSDNDYLKSVISGGNSQSESNVTSSEGSDLDNGGAVADNDNGLSPIDSLKKWGRRVTNVHVDYSITDYGDTMKSVLVTRTISGYYVIRAYSGGNPDSVSKPYTEVFTRTVSFKRISNRPDPSLNWALYQVSMANGKTTLPQVGTNQITINNISVYVNGSLTPNYIFNGPDFTQNVFTTVWFGGDGIPKFNRNDQVRIVVALTSNQADTDYVAWHWARNTFGFHRVPFTLTSNVGGVRTYEKTFTIYAGHKLGVFNGFISANTHKSLWDDDPSIFSSTTAGALYKVVQ